MELAHDRGHGRIEDQGRKTRERHLAPSNMVTHTKKSLRTRGCMHIFFPKWVFNFGKGFF
jgi:hypothetical protein